MEKGSAPCHQNQSPAVAGLIEAFDWRSNRSGRDDSENLNKLGDPAPEYQRQMWKKAVVINHDLKPTSDNFEDIYGYYKTIHESLSRTSSYDDIDSRYKSQKKEYRRNCLLFYPDKNLSESPQKKLFLLRNIKKQSHLWKMYKKLMTL